MLSLMSLNPWFIRLSTLSRRDAESGVGSRVALRGPDSSEVGRSNLRGSVGAVGDTIDATLMLLFDGDMRG